MDQNLIVSILEKQAAENADRRKLDNWGILKRGKLVEVIEQDGGKVSTYMWDMLLVSICNLGVNDEGKVYYESFYPRSKRVDAILSKHNDAIIKQIDYINCNW